jgi:phosphomannomutase
LGNELLDGLPLTIVPLYFELDGTFPNHPANPLEPENLLDLQAAVLEHGADIGLAFDGDADRCFVVDETGRAVSPSAITAMIAVREIARAQAQGEAAPAVIHNLITSRAVPEFVEQAGGRPVRTRVGHSFIKARMAEENAVFGGEHSAHYYFRDFYNADTGLLAAMHVLAALGEQDAPLSTLAGKFEPYSASGEINSAVTDADHAIAAVRNSYEPAPGVAFDESDGLTIAAESGHWWFNVRASNTEELLRLNVEANDAATMQSVRDAVLDLIRN